MARVSKGIQTGFTKPFKFDKKNPRMLNWQRWRDLASEMSNHCLFSGRCGDTAVELEMKQSVTTPASDTNTLARYFAYLLGQASSAPSND